MEIRKQVCTIDQAKTLTSLNLKVGANFYFMANGQLISKFALKEKLSRTIHEGHTPEHWPAFTGTELGIMLPPYTVSKYFQSKELWQVNLMISGVDLYEEGKTEAIARAEMLIRLLSHSKYRVFTDEVKERLIEAENLEI